MDVFDTSFLVLAFDPNAKGPIDPATGQPLTHCQQRVDHLLRMLGAEKRRVLIPTPVLAEYLVRGGADKDKRLQEFIGSKSFLVAPFDLRAAIECAMIEDGDSKRIGASLSEVESKAKVKFDRQIIAIAKARGATIIYTGDLGLAACARRNKLQVVLTFELPLPPEDQQINIEYGD